MNDLLQQIVAKTRERIAAEPLDWQAAKRAAKQRAETRVPFLFAQVLRGEMKPRNPRIIAEIKAASPSAGVIVDNPDVESIARAYAEGGASAISVVAERDFFHGSREWIGRAANAAGLPVIMKDFIVEPSQAIRGVAAGASAVLLLASLLDRLQIRELIGVLDELGCDALVEVHDERELEEALEGGAKLVGVNNRDLRDFSVDLAASERLISGIPSEVIRVSESGIRSAADIQRLFAAGFDAFLVGESLLRQNDQRRAVSELLG